MATQKNEGDNAPDILHPDTGNIAQIRDILFGDAQRTNEQKFEALEKSLSDSFAKLNDHISDMATNIGNRIADLSAHMDQEVAALQTRLDDVEATLRSEAGEQGQDMRDALDSTSKALQADIKALQKELRKELAALDDKKTTREDLASYLVDIGERLRGAQPGSPADVNGATGSAKRGKAAAPANGGTDKPDGDT